MLTLALALVSVRLSAFLLKLLKLTANKKIDFFSPKILITVLYLNVMS